MFYSFESSRLIARRAVDDAGNRVRGHVADSPQWFRVEGDFRRVEIIPAMRRALSRITEQ